MEWFQDGTRLLVSGNAKQGEGGRAIWVISTVSGAMRVLRDDAWGAAISPEGSRIAFRNSKQNEIWVMGQNGEDPRRLLAAPEGYMFERLVWSRDGGRVAYIKSTIGLDKVAIESVAASGSEPVLMLADQRIIDFCWVPDGRIIVSLSEPPPNEYDSNLWEFRADPGTGGRSGELRRITSWAGFGFRDISLSRDGKRMGFSSRRDHSDVYVGELRANGAQLANVRRLTVDERIDWPGGWTRDGKILFVSDRNGNLDVFRQGVEAQAADTVVTGTDDKRSPQSSPDGTWVLYLAWPKSGCCVSDPTGKIMRVRATGGLPESVFDVKGYPGSAQVPRLRNVLSARGNPNFRCPVTPAAPCVVGEFQAEELIFAAFDPVKGRGGEIARLHTGERNTSWDLSPDGQRIAVGVPERTRALITILPMAGGPRREIVVKGWSGIFSLGWSADGASLFVTIHTTRLSSLLHVTMNGEARVLRQTTGSLERPVVSPDGRYLAFGERVSSSNAWVIEKF